MFSSDAAESIGNRYNRRNLPHELLFDTLH
jgi:hypothetical protein